MTLRGRGRVGRVKYLGVWQRVGPRGGPGGRGGPCVWRRRQTGRAQSSEPRQLRWQQVGCSGSYGGPGRGRGRGTGSGPRAGEGAGVRGQGRGGAGSGGSGVSGMGRCAGPGLPCIPPGARIPQSGHGGGGGGGGGDGVCVAATVCGRWLPGPRPPRRRAVAPVPGPALLWGRLGFIWLWDPTTEPFPVSLPASPGAAPSPPHPAGE